MKLGQRCFRQVRGRLLGRLTILGYHRVGASDDPFGLAVAARNFADQIEILARRTNPMTLSNATRALTEGVMPLHAVVVTFDDGYRDTLEEALPVLERTGVPATVFVCTGWSGREFWWDELARMLLCGSPPPDRLETAIRGRRYSWSLQGAAARRRALMSIAEQLRVLRPAEREDVMRDVRQSTGQSSSPTTGQRHPRALTSSELRSLSSSSYLEIGAHTVSHPVLSLLTRDEQREEIHRSRESLEAITATTVNSFSYPHGAYSADTLSIAAEAGFTAACCSRPDVVTRRSNPLALPRLWPGNRDARSFSRWLDGWLFG